MAKIGVHEIRKVARAVIAQNAGGIRFGQIVDEISRQYPETPRNTIAGSIWNLDVLFPKEVTKPSRGLWKPAVEDGNGQTTDVIDVVEAITPGVKLRESDFYEPFAEWLKNDLDEVTDVAPLGGAGLKSKWGTPDVIGVYKPLASNLIKFPLEVVSAEVKIDPAAPVVAFGQAIAYRLFSAKTYMAMPTSLTAEDQSRLEALCMLFGVGLVLFDLDLKNPNFSIRVRAQRFSPDMFYVNEFADRLRMHDPDTFEHLFR
jgi:hypothetical protein